mmetsp:Transcript_21073/g.60942  ORF Transcript_21073/g.60942 Transcript_21073/m.60942 type:complete len:230 (+) Transcript_21073:534-1223(+)
MTTEGDTTLSAIIAGEVHGEARLHCGVLLGHLREEAELGGQCQGVQAETQDAVKGKEAKRVLRHLRSQYDTQVHTSSLPGLRLGALAIPEAHDLTHELAEHLPGPEGDGHLVALCRVGADKRPVVLDVHRRGRRGAAVAPVAAARLATARGRRQDEMPRARVKDDGEGLPGLLAADLEGAEVGRLVGHDLAALLHWHVLLLQRNRKLRGRCVPTLRGSGRAVLAGDRAD